MDEQVDSRAEETEPKPDFEIAEDAPLSEPGAPSELQPESAEDQIIMQELEKEAAEAETHPIVEGAQPETQPTVSYNPETKQFEPDLPPVEAPPVEAPPVEPPMVWNEGAQCWVPGIRVPEDPPQPPTGKRWDVNAQQWV